MCGEKGARYKQRTGEPGAIKGTTRNENYGFDKIIVIKDPINDNDDQVVTYMLRLMQSRRLVMSCVHLWTFLMMAVTVDREYIFVDDVNNYVVVDVNGSKNC